MSDQKLADTFVRALGVAPETVCDSLEYNSIPQWDSAGHMSLVAELETEFDVMLDTDDIIAMSSVKQARTILQKYGVLFDAA